MTMPAATADSSSPRWAALLGVTAALAMFGAAQGLSYPLFTLLMQRQGMPPSLIGLSAAMMPLGLVLSAPLIPRAVAAFGAKRLAVGCALAAALCFVCIAALQNWFAWFALRFLLGFIVNPIYVLGEVWALALSPPERRGRMMGVFNALMGAGYAVGPLAMTVVGSAGWPPFIVAICGFLACTVILQLVSNDLRGFDADGQPKMNVLSFARVAPALLLAVLVSASCQQSTYSLMPVFGAAYGLRDAVLAALVTALSVGNIVLQIPLGLAAEKVGARAMIITCATATATCILLLPVLVLTPWVWPVLVVMGGVGYGVYTMALVELGNRFSGSTLVAGNAAFALMWGAGGIVGPPVAGASIQAAGPLGLVGVIAGLSLFLVAFALWRSLTRRA